MIGADVELYGVHVHTVGVGRTQKLIQVLGIDVFDNVFAKRVYKFFRKGRWALEQSTIVNFVARREIFTLHVYLGPELFDRRFPPVASYFTNKAGVLRSSVRKPYVPNILVVIRDRDTLPLYRQTNLENVSLVHSDDLPFVDDLKLATLTAPTHEGTHPLAISIVEKNAQLCRQLAARSSDAGNLSGAIFWAEKFVAADPDNGMAHMDLAVRRLRSGLVDEAAKSIAVAVELLPAAAIILNRASVIAVRQGRRAEALEFAQRAVAAKDKRSVDYEHLARTYLGRAQIQLATAAIEEALLLEPENPRFQATSIEIRDRPKNGQNA